MKKIIENMNYNLYKNNKIYKLQISHYNSEFRNILVNSIINTNLIKGGCSDEDNEEIKFNAYIVETLEDYLKYLVNDKSQNEGYLYSKEKIITKIINDLAVQLKYLIEEEKSIFLGYNYSDILVINREKFIYMGCEFIAKLDNRLYSTIYMPYNETDFYFSPEYREINNLPAKISYKSSYYSFGYLIFLIYLNLINEKYIISLESQLGELKNIIPYKLYYFLERCLERNCEDRFIIYI